MPTLLQVSGLTESSGEGAHDIDASGRVFTWGFPKIRRYLFGGPHNMDYTVVFWAGLYWGPPILGNYHMGLTSGSLGLSKAWAV